LDDEDLTPEPVEVAAVLDAAIVDPDPAKVIEALAPSSPEYAALRRAYAEYRAVAAGTRTVRGRSEHASPERTAAAEPRARPPAPEPSGAGPSMRRRNGRRQRNDGHGSLRSISNVCAGCRGRCLPIVSSSMQRSRGCSCSTTTGRCSRPGWLSAKSTSRLPSS